MEKRGRHQSDRLVPMRAAGLPHHEERLDLGACTASEFDRLYVDETRDHRIDEDDLARWSQIRHRLWSDRYWQRRDRSRAAHGRWRAAGGRLDQGRALDGPRSCRRRDRLYGRPAAAVERAIFDDHGDENAVCWQGLK